MKFSSNPNASVQRCPNPLFQRTLLITTLALQDQSQGHILSFFYTLLRDLSLSMIPVDFFSQTYLFHHVGKILEFIVLTFLENALNLGLFTHVPTSLSKLALKFLSLHPRQREITNLPRQCFCKSVSPNSRKEWQKL